MCHENIIILETDFNSLLRETTSPSPTICISPIFSTVFSFPFHPSWLLRVFSILFYTSLLLHFLPSIYFVLIVGTACRRWIKFSPRTHSEQQNGLLNILTIQAVIVICEMIRMGWGGVCLYLCLFEWVCACVRKAKLHVNHFVSRVFSLCFISHFLRTKR